MTLYDLLMKPLESGILGTVRSEIIPLAQGKVLEIGIGTGANLKYYNTASITTFTGLDREYSRELGIFPAFHIDFIEGAAESLPFPNACFDSVVSTLVLCTADTGQSLHEVWRVLKPGGRFIFIEHVRPHGNLAGKVTDTLNFFWNKLAHGCNLNRRTDELIKLSGFTDLALHYKGSDILCYGHATKPV